jgi:hypothetical protein
VIVVDQFFAAVAFEQPTGTLFGCFRLLLAVVDDENSLDIVEAVGVVGNAV